MSNQPVPDPEHSALSTQHPNTPTLRVKQAWTAAEMEAIFCIRDEVFVREQRLTHDARHDPDDELSIHFLAYLDDQPVGTGRLTIFGREAQVAWVAVREPHRGSGIGNEIMEAIITRSERERAGYILLNAQTHAISFYEHLRFEIIGGEFFMGGISHHVMVRRLG
jgi:predicted GNAT family N-acyltransferase